VKSADFGYTVQELENLPEGADLSLGCGNPTALAELQDGQTIVDLGSGGGIDVLLASKRVGPSGKAIGVDMTAEMVTRARGAAQRGGYTNVEFRLGEIENLPVADEIVDVIISNCVINLSPEKERVFSEALRVLKPGGYMTVSDIVLTRDLDPELRDNAALLTGCISGALLEEEYLAAIRAAGFGEVRVESSSPYAKPEHLAGLAREAGISEAETKVVADSVKSITVKAWKAN
jgi:ubiquinone/menaquinone biosynthesis C-methylase UbiE